MTRIVSQERVNNLILSFIKLGMFISFIVLSYMLGKNKGQEQAYKNGYEEGLNDANSHIVALEKWKARKQ